MTADLPGRARRVVRSMSEQTQGVLFALFNAACSGEAS